MKKGKFTFRTVLGSFLLAFGYIVPASAQSTEPAVERVVITLDPLQFTGVTDEDEGQKLWNELMKYKFWGTDSMRTKDDFRVEEASGYTGTAKGGVFFEGENHTLGGPILSGKDLNLGSSKNDKFIKGPVYANDLKFADNWKSSWGQSFDGIYCFTGKVAINMPNENQNRSEYVNVLSGFVELVHREDLANGKKRGRVYADWGNNLTDAEKQRVDLDGPASDCPSGNDPDAVPRPETSLTVPVLTDVQNLPWKTGLSLNGNFTEFVHIPPVSLDDVGKGTVWYDNYLESISINQEKNVIYIVMPSSTQNCENSKDPVTGECYKKTGRLTRIFVRNGIKIEGSASDAKIMVAYVNDGVVWDKNDGKWKYKDGDEYRNITKENIKVVPDTAYSGNLMFYTPAAIKWPQMISSCDLQGTYISAQDFEVQDHVNLAGQLIAGKKLIFGANFKGRFHYVPFNSPEIKTNVFSNDKFKESNDVWYDMDFYLTDTVHTEVSFDYCFAFFDEVTDADTKYAYYKTPDAGNRSEEFAKREDLAENPTDENDPHFMPFCKDGKKKHVVIKKNTRKPSEPFYIKVIEDSKQEGSEYMIFRIMNLNGATISGGVFDGGLVVRLVDDNKAPHFTGTKPSPLIVPENAKNENGKKVEAGQILAEDDDDDDVLFSVIDGSAKDLFEIDKKTGVVTMKDGVDAFDYEAWKASGDKYQIEVEICDDKFFQLCDSRMFEIVIGDVNEKPYFDYGTTDKKEIKIAENEYFSDENVKFADLDTYTNKNGDIIKNTSFTNDSVSAIGGDTDVFDVTKNGAVKTKPGVVLDYETKSTYKLTLRVQDATRDADGNLKYPDLYDEMEITVLVTDVDDGPKFEFKTYNGTVVENSIAPTEVNMDHAIHAETSQIGATITYSLLDDSKSFVIDPNTGVITVAAGAVLDYETKNVYEMKVVASDASGVAGQIMQTDTAAVIISLIDVNEMPVFVEPTTALSFPENQKGYPIGTLTFDDLDTASGFRNNKFECLNCEDLGFYLDETTGELSTTRRFDYETEEKTYKLNIVIKDVDDATLSTTGSITVALTNVYEFTELVYTVLESDTVGTPFKKALEVDNTEGLSTTLKFSILDGSTEVDATKEFKLDSVTGKFSVASPLDYETTESYSVRVRAKDENGVYGDTTITINVIDVNEAPSIFVDTIYVRENQAVNDPFSTVKTDKDDPDTKNPDFRNNVYDNTDKGDVVKILPNGDAILMKPIDYETDSLYEITVRVTDKDDSKLTSTKNVIVKVIDVYEKSEVEITRVETKDSIYINTNDTIFVNQDIVDIEWKQDEKPKSSTDSLKLGCNEVIKTFHDKTKNDPGADTVIICYSNAAPIVTISANGENVTAENIYTVVEKATKNDTAIYVNKVKNDIKVTVTDTASHVTKSFTVSLELDTVSVPSKDFKDVKNIAETEVTRNKKPASGITSIPENGDYVKNSYTETVNGLEVTVSYYTDNKGKDVKRPVITASGQKKDIAVIEVSYTTKVDGKDVTISYFADASTGERVTLNTGLTDSESVLSADGDDVIGSYKVTYNYEDKNGNTVEVSYYLDEKGKIAKNTEGNIGYNVSYTYVNKFGNSSKKTVFIVLDQKGPVVKIVSPSEDDVLTANFAEVKWTVNGVEQDTLRVQGLDNGVQTIVRVFRDKAGNESRDSVHVMVKNVKNIDINVEKPVTLVDRDSVEKFYKTKPPKKDQTYGVTFYNNKKKGETEAVIGIKGKAKDGSGEEPYPGLEGHLGPTLTVDARVPVVNALGGLATLDDIISSDGQVALDGVDAANSRKVSVSEYVENYCTDEFKKSMKSDYSKMNLYWTTIRVKVWVYSNTGVFADYYTFDYDLDDPDYVNDAGLLKFFFELKPDENGDVRTNDGRLYGTGAYLFKTEVKMTSKLRCDLPTSPEEEENVKASKKRNAVIRSSDELLKSFGYRRPVNN